MRFYTSLPYCSPGSVTGKAQTVGRAILCFFATLVTMAITIAGIACIIFTVVLALTAGKWGLGAGFLFVILGPALADLLAIFAAIFAGSGISRQIWPRPPVTV